jgi:hypothetical protein
MIIKIKFDKFNIETDINNDLYYQLFGENLIDELFSIDNEIKILDLNELNIDELKNILNNIKETLILFFNKKFLNMGEAIYFMIDKIVNENETLPENIEILSKECSQDYYFGEFIKKYNQINYLKMETDRYNHYLLNLPKNEIDTMLFDIMNCSTLNDSGLSRLILKQTELTNIVGDCIKSFSKDKIEEIIKLLKNEYSISKVKIKNDLKNKIYNKDFIMDFLTKLYMSEELKPYYDEIISCVLKLLDENKKIKIIADYIVDNPKKVEYINNKYLYIKE